MSKQLATINSLLERSTKGFASVLPKHITPERMIRIAASEYNKNKALQSCDPLSFCAAVMEAAQLGLEPASALHHCYLVPYAGQVKLMLGYRGKIELIRRHPDVTNFQIFAVYRGDVFTYNLGLYPDIKHEPKGESDELTHVYGIVTFRNGSKEFQVMTRGEVERVRDKFSKKDKRTGNFSDAWVDSFDEMAKKTLVHRMAKTLPMANEYRDVIMNVSGNIIEMEQDDAETWQKAFEAEAIPTPTEEQVAAASLGNLLAAAKSQGLEGIDQYQAILESGDTRRIVAASEVIREKLNALESAMQ